MMKRLTFLFLAVASLGWCSCQRRPIYYEDTIVNVKFDIDHDIVNYSPSAPEPELMKTGFYKSDTYASLSEHYIGPEGGYVNISPMSCHVFAYSFDTEVTQVRYDGDLLKATAYTEPITPDAEVRFNNITNAIRLHNSTKGVPVATAYDYSAEPVKKQPDHLYAGTTYNVTIPYRTCEDYIHTIVVPVSSVVMTWQLEIGPVVGQEYLSSAEAFITGQTEEKLLHSNEATGGICTLNVPLITTARSNYLTTTFNTFGHKPGAPAYVILHLTDLVGNSLIYECDVTSQFDDPANTEQIIRVEHAFEIKEPEGESVTPSVIGWEEDRYDIIL